MMITRRRPDIRVQTLVSKRDRRKRDVNHNPPCSKRLTVNTYLVCLVVFEGYLDKISSPFCDEVHGSLSMRVGSVGLHEQYRVSAVPPVDKL